MADHQESGEVKMNERDQYIKDIRDIYEKDVKPDIREAQYRQNLDRWNRNNPVLPNPTPAQKARTAIIGATLGVLSSFMGGQKPSEAKAITQPVDEPGKPTIIIPNANISDHGDPTRQKGRQSIEEAQADQEKSVAKITVVEQTEDGNIKDTGKTLGDLNGESLSFTQAIFDTLSSHKEFGFDWVTSSNINYLVVDRKGMSVEESAKLQKLTYLIVDKDTVDNKGVGHEKGDLIIVNKETGHLAYLPLGGQTRKDVKDFAAKNGINIEGPISTEDISFSISNDNWVVVWVKGLPVALSDYPANPPKSGLFSDSLKAIVPGTLGESFSGGFEVMSDGSLKTPDGNMYLIDNRRKLTKFEIKSIDVNNGTYTDSAGNVKKIIRLKDGSSGVIKNKKFDIQINNGFSPKFDAIFEKWGNDIVINKDGKDVVLKVAMVKVPVKGKSSVSVKYIFGEDEGAYCGITTVNKQEGHTQTGYTYKSVDQLRNTLVPGMQVYVETYTDHDSKYFSLDTAEKDVMYGDMMKSTSDMNRILRDLKSGKPVNPEDLIFTGSIAIPEVK
jgi:hypothetical protein